MYSLAFIDEGFSLQNTGILYLTERKRMIYLQNTTEPQALFIPRSQRGVEGTLHFSAESNMELADLISIDVSDLDTSDLYYDLSVTLPDDLPGGEYDYRLTDDAGILSQGILVVGDSFTIDQYEKDVEYEQYTK